MNKATNYPLSYFGSHVLHTLLCTDGVTGPYCILSTVLMVWIFHTDSMIHLYLISSTLLMICLLHTEYPPLYCKSLYRVNLFHSDETFHVYDKQELFISNKIYKKACTFFKMVVFTKCNEKNCLEVQKW